MDLPTYLAEAAMVCGEVSPYRGDEILQIQRSWRHRIRRWRSWKCGSIAECQGHLSVPLAMAFGEAGEELHRVAPNEGIAAIVSKGVSGLLHDGMFDDKACARLFSLIENARTIEAHHGQIQGVRGKAFQEILGLTKAPLQVRRGSAEQSNTSILFGDAFHS